MCGYIQPARTKRCESHCSRTNRHSLSRITRPFQLGHSEARRSLAAEVRFALLPEGSNSFAMVFGLEQFGQAGADPRPKFLPIRIECAAESIFQFSNRKRRIRCYFARELGRGRDQLFMWHNPGDEPNLKRPIGIDD